MFTTNDDSSDSFTFFLSSQSYFGNLLLGESIDYCSSYFVNHLSLRSNNSRAAGTPICMTPALE
jgi:hypothetical protein